MRVPMYWHGKRQVRGVRPPQTLGARFGVLVRALSVSLSVHRPEEFVEALGEARRCRDEVPGSGRDETRGLQLVREGVANPLQRRCVAA